MPKVVVANATAGQAPPPPPPPGHAGGDFLSALSRLATPSPEAIGTAVAIVAAIILFILIARARVTAIRPLTVIGEVIRPSGMVDRVKLIMVSPGIFVDRDGKHIAIIPSDAKPLTKVEGNILTRRRVDYYLLVDNGHGVLHYVNPRKVELAVEHEKMIVTSLADLIVKLYKKKELPGEIRIRPSVRLLVYIDPRRELESEIRHIARFSEEAVVGIANMTGKRKEFENYVKALLELEEAKLRGTVGLLVKYVLPAILITAIIAAVIANIR